MQGKVALVTGSAKGLGRGFTETLLKRGAQVCVSDIDGNLGEKTMASLQEAYGADAVMFSKCDTTSQQDMERMFDDVKKRYGRLDLVVNNAGIIHERQWEKMVDVNLYGVIRGTMLGLQHMGRDQGGHGGQIINIASAAGITAVPFMPSYCASKTAVVAYTRSWGMNPMYQDHGVRINCLCPYFTKTDIVKISSDQCFGLSLTEDTFQATGLMEVSDVVRAFEVFLENDNLNGAVLKVSVRGHKFVEFPKTGFEGLNANVNSKL